MTERLFDSLLGGKPFMYVDIKGGRITGEVLGFISLANAEAAVVTVESRAFRQYRERRDSALL